MSQRIPLPHGFWAVVDDADYAAVVAAGPWHARRRGRTVYARRNVRRPDGRWTSQAMHTFLTGWPETDHVNLDGLDNRRANLREATRPQNLANTRRHIDNTSGFKGVSWYKRNRRWHAQIMVSGRRQHLGYYDTAEEAAVAYDSARIEASGEYARVNFPRTGAAR